MLGYRMMRLNTLFMSKSLSLLLILVTLPYILWIKKNVFHKGAPCFPCEKLAYKLSITWHLASVALQSCCFLCSFFQR